jgi:hypothetical protein
MRVCIYCVCVCMGGWVNSGGEMTEVMMISAGRCVGGGIGGKREEGGGLGERVCGGIFR